MKLPLKLSSYRIMDDDDFRIADIGTTHLDDAKEIVHACNVHDELLKLAEREAQMPCCCAGPHSECISCTARKLVAKATGESS